MSEVKLEDGELENGETGNELPVFTLSAVHPDYDIVVDPAVMSPAFFTNLCKMAERTYKHILSNEALASKGYKDAEGNEAKQQEELRKWRQARRELIVTGELGFRQTGPRISDLDREWRDVIDDDVLKPAWIASGEEKAFPTSGKALIQGTSLDDWREAIKASPKYAHLRDKAQANVDAARARAEQAKATAGGQKTNAFANLLA